MISPGCYSIKKINATKKLEAENFSPTRVYVGKKDNRESEVTLYDAAGKARVKMIVTANGTPRLEFLDGNGNVTYSLPSEGVKPGIKRYLQ